MQMAGDEKEHSVFRKLHVALWLVRSTVVVSGNEVREVKRAMSQSVGITHWEDIFFLGSH